MDNYDRNHRSGIDIVVSILEFVDNRGASLKTHILYGANLNSRSLEKYLTQLITAGLLMKSVDEGKEKYLITVRGRLFLQHLGRALNLLRSKKEAAVSESLKKKIKSIKEAVKVREGLVYRGSSGVHYLLPIAFLIEHGNGDKIAGIMEIINSEMTPKEAISVIGWVWIISKDLKVPALILVSENHIRTVRNITEFLGNGEGGIILIKYEEYESPEAISRKIIDKILNTIDNKM